MSKGKFSIAAVVLCIIAGVIYFGWGWFFPNDPLPSAVSPAGDSNTAPSQLVCTGMVESPGGEVDVCAQMPGELTEVRVTEGDSVQKGQVLAVVDARRLEAEIAVAEANVKVAEAKLKRVRVGTGDEEKQEAFFAVQATEALLAYERKNLDRLRSLHQTKSVLLDELQRIEQQVEHLVKQAESLKRRHAALLRGPLPEEIEAARTEVILAEERLRQAKVNYSYHLIPAPIAGKVVQVMLHAGDSVSIEQVTPIVRLVDTTHLRIRLEIDEADVARLATPLEGVFEVRGLPETAGRFKLATIIPHFGPKRLFNPDMSARVDTRTLAVLCDIAESKIPLYPGQRITAHIPLTSDALRPRSGDAIPTGGRTGSPAPK
jgi:HlyD family secretion protein